MNARRRKWTAPEWLLAKRTRWRQIKSVTYDAANAGDATALDALQLLVLVEMMGEALEAYANITDDASRKLMDALSVYRTGPPNG